jgi:hypothetical protein
LFFKNRKQKGKLVLCGDWYWWEGGGYKESIYKGEDGKNIMYKCMYMEKLDILNGSSNGGRGDKGE